MNAHENKQGLRPMDYHQVHLENSHWKQQQIETIERYLGITDDDMLHSIRLAAGIASTVNGMEGWGPSIGQYLGSYAKLFAATGDFRLKAKCLSLYNGYAACVDKAQYMLDQGETMNDRDYRTVLNPGTYVYEKYIGGMMDMAEFLGIKDVQRYVEILTRHAMKNYDTEIDRDGFQDHRMKGQIEWYTLGESLLRAYEMFGDEMYKSFALTWNYDYYYKKILQGAFEMIGPRHAYSHVNSLSTAAKTYQITGDDDYLHVIEKAYDEILRHHTYATGGYGPAENLFVQRPGYLGDMLLSPWDIDEDKVCYDSFAGKHVARSDAWGNCEVSCCAWAVFKLCHYLLRFTGDARYGEWAEKMLINGTGGQPPITERGELLYYANYFVDGAIKSVEDRRLTHTGQNFRWQCCSGTFPQDVAEYNNMLYYMDDEGVFVSQYLPSTAAFCIKGANITIQQYHDFPTEQGVKLWLSSDTQVDIILRLRVPHWAGGNSSLWVNGKERAMTAKPNTWATIPLCLSGECLVEMKLPYTLRFEAVDEQHPDIVALCYGPIVLCSTEMTFLVGDRERPQDWIVPAEGKPLTFQTLKGHAGHYEHIQRTFVPYYQLETMKWYYMYNRIMPTLES